MKVLIQNPFTRSFLQAPGKWTSDSDAALVFPDSQSALGYCAQHGLYDLHIAIRFPNHSHDVEIPVLSGLPGNRQPESYERWQATAVP